MKAINSKYLLYLLLIGLVSCDHSLDEQVIDELEVSNFWQSDEDAILGVNAVYAVLRGGSPVTDRDNEPWGFFNHGTSILHYSEVITDEIYAAKWADPGSTAYDLQNYLLTANENVWTNPFYKHLFHGVFIANDVIHHVENNNKLSSDIRDRVIGEALFGRAFFYYHLLSLYGNIPLLFEVNTDPFNKPSQASPEQVAEAIITDLSEASELLPTEYSSENYGRFTQGAALSLLARFYLNQHRWSEAEMTARQVLGMYELSSDYSSIFAPENTGNPEIILSLVCIPEVGMGNTFFAYTAESDFASGAWGGLRMRDDFYATFDVEDIRRTFLIKDYTSLGGNSKTLNEGRMIMKYAVDPQSSGPWAGNDIVILRYADLLFSLAEAINEQYGPTQEAIDLVNQLRSRAFPGNPDKLLSLSDFDKESFRNHLLAERGWELYAEGYRREDLIRHGKLVSNAQERGISTAEPYQVLFPIHQNELDLNPNLVQNPGYN